jgi:hypothetical protein
MKVPRFRIAWIMVAVAIAALDFWAIDTDVVFLLGALPMANVLAIGILILQRRPGSRPFLLGFVAFGAIAFAIYIGLANGGMHDDLLMPYFLVFTGVFERIAGRDRPFVFIPLLCFGTVVMLCGPQIVFALIGGFLSRRFRPAITRR